MLLDNHKMTNYINFEAWTADQVAEWLRGLDLDDAIVPYVHCFLERNIDGRKLLLLTHADLERLNVHKLGHQELILEAVDLLRSLHYGYETENLQSIALQLGCKARSLNGEVRARTGENDKNRANMAPESRSKRLSILILSSVADLIATLKSLVAWMDKAPFSVSHDLCLVRNTIVKIGLDLINMCQREASIPDVELNLSTSTQMLSDICEELVIGSQETHMDPLYIQPASLELATIRKKQGEELGMHILSSYYGVHAISGIKDMSPANLCGKIEKGDEVIQVNYQTVVGWQLKKLVNTLKEKPKEVVLLLKKRPRHSSYGQMPNKRKQNLMNKHAVQSSTLPKSLKKLRSRDGETIQLRPSLHDFVNSVPSTSDELYSPKADEVNDGNDTDNDVFRSGSESPQFTLPVQVDPKQRRATVSGGSPTLCRPLLVIEDIDTPPQRPKSFTITGNGGNMHTEIIINSPAEDENLTELHRAATAINRRQEYQTKSTPPSLEFSVRKPTPKILEPHYDSDDETEMPINATKITVRAPDSDLDSPTSDHHDVARTARSPENVLDSSTDSVPPSDSSLESSRVCTSSLESSSHSPPLEDSSAASSEKESSDLPVFESSFPKTVPQNFELPRSEKSPSPRRMISSEVAGSEMHKNEPQLVKIRKIDSVRMSDAEADRVQQEVKKKVAFSGVDSDRDSEDNQSYVHIVVGGVVQKIPASSPSNSPSVVKRRQKTGGRSKKADRRVSCKDLGVGDCQGWLYKRRDKGVGWGQSHWWKRWCVLKQFNLYSYKDKADLKADGVVYLPAFQVSPVDQSELKTKKHAFKIHNAGTSFYFASDRQEDMKKWMNCMGLAAVMVKDNQPAGFHKPEPDQYYSESDDDDEFAVSRDPSPTPSSLTSSPGTARSVANTDGASSRSTNSSIDSMSASGLSFPASQSDGNTAGLGVMAADLRASQENVATLMRRHTQKGIDIFTGNDKNALRRSTISREVTKVATPEHLRMKRLKALERTLKAKEKELSEIDIVLKGDSDEKLSLLRNMVRGSGAKGEYTLHK